MQLYTGCPNCNKAITADLKYKEVDVGPGDTKLAAIVGCPNCRTNIEVHITTKEVQA